MHSHRYLFLSVFLFAALTVMPAMADKEKVYHEAEPNILLDYTAQNRVLSFDADINLLEYIQVKNCDLYARIKNDQFQIQTLKQKIAAAIEKLPPPPSIRVFVPATLLVTGYNFNTQSLQLSSRSTIKRVGIMDLYNMPRQICDDSYKTFQYLPAQYAVKLMRPLSLLRIPIKEDVAKYILQNLDQSDTDRDSKIIYVTFSFTIEGMDSKISSNYRSDRRVLMLGQLDGIDFFMDKERKMRVKHMDLEAFN